MKKIIGLATALVMCLMLVGCEVSDLIETTEPDLDAPTWLELNMDYPKPMTLENGGGRPVKVIVLIGQSNATGCGLNSYLEKNLGAEKYNVYAAGFSSVWINYCLDDHRSTSHGEFVKVDMTCGATDGYFGPEVGLAEKLAEAYSDEIVVILKYTMSGYSLHQHWLAFGERGSIYGAFMEFARTYMDALIEAGYDARIGAICWMQGESDTTEHKAQRYFDNQTKLVSYLRQDLSQYAEEGGIYFIDAGISNSPYCEPAYPEINAAKERFAATSELNLYFSTIDAGLTVHQEPEGEPDWGHYDSLSVLKLGHMFGEQVIRSYQQRQVTAE
jgi:hypothetical protein